ncbi:MAG: hypothetical protein JOZ52_05305 [Acidobacteria bacterium]|nr:hypothetical protein [Acidobacteriota bacterium]
MKLKLAAFLLSIAALGLAGCSATETNTSTGNANTPAATANNNNAAPSTVAKNDQNMIEAKADATETTGGTKEGCKCSAAGMSCNNKEGQKGCCGGKDGECSTMKNGASKCCASADKCCSVAKNAAAKNMDKKEPAAPAAEPAKKS